MPEMLTVDVETREVVNALAEKFRRRLEELAPTAEELRELERLAAAVLRELARSGPPEIAREARQVLRDYRQRMRRLAGRGAC